MFAVLLIPSPSSLVGGNDYHPVVHTGSSLKGLLEQLAEVKSTMKEQSTTKLKMLEDRLEKTEQFEEDFHYVSEWFRTQQKELFHVGPKTMVPKSFKEQLVVHQVSVITLIPL